MTRSFFQRLEELEVAYLLISGQATVLYGAAEFSEDLDLWVEPSAHNIARLASALRAERGTYYKLTPQLTEETFRRGHGFHFVVGGNDSFYLDIMGKPPRVGAFELAFQKREIFETPLGRIPAISLKELAELKKTQRLRDYSIIGALARQWVSSATFRPSADEASWVWENVFSVGDLEEIVAACPAIAAMFPSGLAKAYAQRVIGGEPARGEMERALEEQMHARMSALQQADREYWKEIIAELRAMRLAGTLAAEGSPV